MLGAKHCSGCGEVGHRIERCPARAVELDAALQEKLRANSVVVGECHEWTGLLTAQGYGWTYDWRTGKHRFAHRLAFRLHNGHDARPLVRHLCHNRRCVNPAHLAEGTDRDNSNDAVLARRHAHGESHGQAKLTEEQVLLARARVAAGETTAAVERDMGLKRDALRAAVRGDEWSHLPGAVGKRPTWRRGADNNLSKLSEDLVRQIRTLSRDGMSLRKIAKQIGVSSGCVQSVLSGRTWRHV